ncbi:phosphoribosyl-AMP cyclohydrolase [Thiovibrio sp. JS02]
MELVCEKYKDKVDSETAVCRRPTEYCKFRSACLIHFLAKERAAKETQNPAPSVERKNNQTVGSANTMSVLRFDKGNGLLPAIAQDHLTNEVLMLAYINEEAWQKTLATGKAHYWSRSRNQIWLKGESSGHVQLVKEILVDCDADTVIYKVEQLGGAACHKGYRSCFFRKAQGEELTINDTPVFDPGEVYKK